MRDCPCAGSKVIRDSGVDEGLIACDLLTHFHINNTIEP
jgi:hypothetical protein